MAHPRAKLTVAGRRLLVERMLEQGWPPARAAEAQGVSVATAYKWLGRWRAEGLAGLAVAGLMVVELLAVWIPLSLRLGRRLWAHRR